MGETGAVFENTAGSARGVPEYQLTGVKAAGIFMVHHSCQSGLFYSRSYFGRILG